MAIRGCIPAPVPSGPEGELLRKFNLRSRIKSEEAQNAKLYEKDSSLCFFGRNAPEDDYPLTDQDILEEGKYFACVSTSSLTALKVCSDLLALTILLLIVMLRLPNLHFNHSSILFSRLLYALFHLYWMCVRGSYSGFTLMTLHRCCGTLSQCK